jgi:hypothetical protein
MAHWYQRARDFLAVGFVIVVIMGAGGVVVVGSDVLARSLGAPIQPVPTLRSGRLP